MGRARRHGDLGERPFVELPLTLPGEADSGVDGRGGVTWMLMLCFDLVSE